MLTKLPPLNNKRVKARHVWQMLVDEHVENGGKRDELGLYVIGEDIVERYQKW